MGSPPTTPGSAPTGPIPPPPYPPYPPYPGPYGPYYQAPPPKRDNLVVIIVVVVAILVAVPIIFAAILYFLVSGLIGAPSSPPIIAFGPVDQTAGNATIPIQAISRGPIDPQSLRILVRVNGTSSSAFDLPPPDGSVALSVDGYTVRVFWLDDNRDGLFSIGDAFWITGNLAPLPRATSFAFDLRSPTGAVIAETIWTTA